RRRPWRDDRSRHARCGRRALPTANGYRFGSIGAGFVMTVLGTSVALIAGLVVFALVVAIVIFRSMWRVAEPNEALVISGIHHKKTADNIGESMGFKIVTGRGTLVIPGIQVVRRLSLDLREAELEI